MTGSMSEAFFTDASRGENRTTWQRDTRVGRRRDGLWLTRMMTELSGGSSRVFRRALALALLRRSAGSMTMRRLLASKGFRLVSSITPRTSSMTIWPFLGPSVRKSGCPSCMAFRQDLQESQGSPGVLRQFRALKNSFAILVLPSPSGPAKMYAWGTLPFTMELFRSSISGPWPRMSFHMGRDIYHDPWARQWGILPARKNKIGQQASGIR
jgi:hypothetical protein